MTTVFPKISLYCKWVDYSAAGLSALTLATNGSTDNTFFAATNLPGGYSIFHDELAGLIVLIPEPGTLFLLGLAGLALMIFRRRT